MVGSRPRGAVAVVVVVLATTLVMCSKTSTRVPAVETPNPIRVKADRTFVGKVAGTDAYVGIALARDHTLAYVCDGASISQWFNGPPATVEGVVLEARNGARLDVHTTADKATGTFAAAGGEANDFEATLAKVPAGLYRDDRASKKTHTLGGWVVLADRAQRGGVLTTTPPPILVSPTTTTSVPKPFISGSISVKAPRGMTTSRTSGSAFVAGLSAVTRVAPSTAPVVANNETNTRAAVFGSADENVLVTTGQGDLLFYNHGAFVRNLATLAPPVDVAVNPQTGIAYFGGGNAMLVVDVLNKTTVASIAGSAGTVAFDRGLNVFYVAGGGLVRAFSSANNTLLWQASAVSGEAPPALAVVEGSGVWVGGSTGTLTFLKGGTAMMVINVGIAITGAAIEPATKEIVVGHGAGLSVFSGGGVPIGTIKTSAPIHGVTTSAGTSRRAYVSVGDGVVSTVTLG